MKRLVILSAVLLSACATQPAFQFNSDTGKKCFFQCKSESARCSSKCSGIICFRACGDAETYCMQACPDVTEVTAQK